MKIVNSNSLSETLDALTELFFYGRQWSKFQKEKVAKWIAGRQGIRGSYANMFGPTGRDFNKGIKLFTGEVVRSRAAIGHILGEEACRSLILLDVPDKCVKDAVRRAELGMMRVLGPRKVRGYNVGMYCCGTCTVAFWRNLLVGGLGNAKQRLAAGMKALKHYRDGHGKWHRFPFYYTLLALNEIELPSAISEMRYAAKVCEEYLKRAPKHHKLDQRRKILIERVLAKC